MSCKIFKQSCQVQVQRFYQRDKTKSWSGLKLSSADDDWDVDLEQWLEYQGYYCEILQFCKVQRFYQRNKTKSWSGLKWSSADGAGDVYLEQKLEYWGYYWKKIQAILPLSCIIHKWNHHSSSRVICWSPQQWDWNQISIWRTSNRVTH